MISEQPTQNKKGGESDEKAVKTKGFTAGERLLDSP